MRREPRLVKGLVSTYHRHTASSQTAAKCWLLLVQLLFVGLLVSADSNAATSCVPIFDPCPSGQTCDVLGECRHSPSRSGELCDPTGITGVNCASGLTCKAGTPSRCEARGQSGESCTGIGQGTCASGLVCDVLGECRHSSASTEGELCDASGLTTKCAAGLTCKLGTPSRCEQRGQSGDSCTGIDQGSCASGLVCDVLGECRHSGASTEGELCDATGLTTQCADGLTCKLGAPSRCEQRGQSKEACTGVGQGTCAAGLVCDFLGECRHKPPEQDELCGLGVPCDSGLTCLITDSGGRCKIPAAAGEYCQGVGQGTCESGLVCDFGAGVGGECRHKRPRLGEPCSALVKCAGDLACTAELGGRCEEKKGLGEVCGGFGQGNCVDNAICSLSRDTEGSFKQRCFPADSAPIPPELCRAFYDTRIAASAKLLTTAVTVSTASTAEIGASHVSAAGAVYGGYGEYGCFVSECIGGNIAAGISTAVCSGVYNDYSVVAGDSTVSVEAVSPSDGIDLSYSTSQAWSTTALLNLIGTESCLSLGVGVDTPASAGLYACTTQVSKVADDDDIDGDGIANEIDQCAETPLAETADAQGCSASQRDSNSNGISDLITLQLGLSPSSTDSDGDGISDAEEIGSDPTHPKDSDFDGVIDALESGQFAANKRVVTGILLQNSSQLSIETEEAQALIRVTVLTPENAPEGLTLPYGLLEYQATAPVGESITLTLSFSESLPANVSLYKVDASDHYTLLPTSAWDRVDDHTLALTLTDGDPTTDLDNEANGIIDDPLAIGFNASSQSRSSGGGGGGGSFGGYGLLLLFALWSLQYCVNRKRRWRTEHKTM